MRDFAKFRDIGHQGQAARIDTLADYLVIEVGAIAGRTLVVVQVRAGEPRTGQQLHPEGSADRWEVRGISFAPTESLNLDRWGLLLRPIEHQQQIHVDTRLLAA